uniref:Zinc finger CCCH-type containing 7Ba n=1 Tax=Cyprinus carpio carpio TaxID=630221 RepID=A0A9J8D2Z9_CYPCA
MSGERQKRREEIQRFKNKQMLKTFSCITMFSLFCFFCPVVVHQGFVVQLVCNLLDEGNAAFREGDWMQALGHFDEAVNVALYAQAEGLNVPAALLESLYINRAAVHQNMGEFDSAVKDCDLALEVCKDSTKALYRKAVCLKESGKLREAYDCSAACLLASPQVNNTHLLLSQTLLIINVLCVCVCVLQRNGHVTSTLSRLSKNPLEHTHDFTQACSSCFITTGVLDFELRSDVTHRCKKDLLLCRRRGGASSPWRRIRPRPTRNNFQASFVLCREVLENQVCKYGEGCTFAYCQEEIDVWTQERRGLLVRELLFNPLSTNERQALGVIELLNIHSGMFMFLCEACFDCKPRMISKRWKENPALCANAPTQHQFDKKKCLVHVVKSSAVSYSKIRAVSSRCHFDVCRQQLALGCKKKDGCCFAHSLIELQIWILQRDTGISHEEIVQESKKHWNKQRAGPVQGTGSAEVKGHGLELMMKFVCGQCWKDGLLSEPDRALKYCTAKARHSWTKDRRVLLVRSHERKKWVTVRPLPFAKTFPQQYDICVHVLKQRKCHYIGNCSFAHSQEEKDLWTYMKNNGCERQIKHTINTDVQLQSNEKQITMPTDFAEATQDGFYCPLCGKHSNSDRQWQQHISSEKHKHRVFSGEGEDESLAWSHRFPGPCFSICPRLDEGCADGASCDFAHSEEELQEWCRRRDFLRRMLNKARADMLISPTDNNFGIYNFLLQN